MVLAITNIKSKPFESCLCSISRDCVFGLMNQTYLQFSAGPALVTTKDAGDAVTLLQSLAGSTFDSSQLVLTASMGYQNVTEERLQELRNKHRPTIRAALEERSKGIRVWRDAQSLSSKLYGFTQDAGSIIRTDKPDGETNGNMSHLNGDVEIDPAKDLQEQVATICHF